MAIREERVIVFGGMGGPNDDSIPVYADNKAPNGAWAMDLLGKQLMFENGRELLCVDYDLLTQEENAGDKYYSHRDGKPYYARVWLIDDETGNGMDWHSQACWVENNKLQAVNTEPEPEPVIKKRKFILTIEVEEVENDA